MFPKLRNRLLARLKRRNLDEETDAEPAFHLEMQAETNVARGMSREEAQRQAHLQIGGIAKTKDAVRDGRATWLDSVAQDLRYAIRFHARHKHSALVGLAVLALAIGINTALFSIVNAFLFRPLPVRAPDELRSVSLQSRERRDQASRLAYKEYLYLRENTDVFREVFAHATDSAVLRVNGEGVRITGEMVTGDYFDVLGVNAVAGRTLTESDEAEDAEPAIVISQSLWTSRFSGDPAILGKTVQIDLGGSSAGHAASDLRQYTIVGIIGGQFHGMVSRWESSDFWVPFVARVPDLELVHPIVGTSTPTRDGWEMAVVGRLRSGITDAQAEAVLKAQDLQWTQAEYPNIPVRYTLVLSNSAVSASLPFEGAWQVVPWRLAAALMAVAAIVLLIAAANLAGLVMARGVVRRGEIAVRLALGAARRRVARQLLTEMLVLALAGGVCAIPLARLLVNVFLAATPARFGGRFSRLTRLSLDAPLDLNVLGFTLLVCVVAGVLIGLPARRASNTDLLAALSGGAATTSRPVRSRLRYWILLPQVCLSLALLISAAALVRSVLRAQTMDHGYDADHVAMVQYQLPVITRAAVPSPAGDRSREREVRRAADERLAAFERTLLARSLSAPGVDSATFAMLLPWESMRLSSRCSVLASKDYGHALGANRWVEQVDASPGYFDTFAIRIVRGRAFDDRDVASGPPVAIVNESLARLLWPAKDAIGEYLARYDPKDAPNQTPEWREVVGVASDTTPALADGAWLPSAYFPLQARNIGNTIVARGHGDANQLVRTLSETVKRADSQALVLDARTARAAIDELLYPRRMAAAILGICGLAGLFLAAVGIYGVVSCSVAQRLREIGIRTALGAARKDILRLVIGEGLRVIVIGSIMGLALATAATRIGSSFVTAIPGIDGLSCAAVSVFLATVILLACYIPARRAVEIDPAEVLRTE
jgi:predicted permease